LTEVDEFEDFFYGTSPLVPVVLNYLWHGAILLLVRWRCLARADRYLGRIPGRSRPMPGTAEDIAH
jgi:hypothetical protein